MPTGPIAVRVVFQRISGLPTDVCVNDLSFVDAIDENSVLLALISFYQGNTGQTNPLATYIGGQITRAVPVAVHMYRLDTPAKLAGGPLGSPFFTGEWGLAPASAEFNQPSEVAMACRFRATYVGAVEEGPANTRPRARRRGRIFLGPLNLTATDESNVNDPRPNAPFQVDCITAMQRLKDDLLTTWGVWSRADATVREVVAVSVDNALDTQRRRGPKATSVIGFG